MLIFYMEKPSWGGASALPPGFRPALSISKPFLN